jgi:hypothetical protein
MAGSRSFWFAEVIVAAAIVTATLPHPAAAQEPAAPPSILRETVVRVAADPTTYVLPLTVYTARRLDWDSSQALFRHGYLEANAAFTVSGRPNDLPIPHGAGNRIILRESLGLFVWSAGNNAASAIVERRLIERMPARRRLIRAAGWAERVAFAAYWTHRLSARQFRQWRDNQRLAGVLDGS